MKKHKLILLTICYFLSFQAVESQETFTTDYTIGPQDLLEIRVFGVSELNTTVRVLENGRIPLPLLGEVDVEGLTRGELEKKLVELLEVKYVTNPQVTVLILEHQSKRVSILGAIRSPGFYELIGRQTLLQVISRAGGLSPEAGKEIFIIRQLPDNTSTSLTISVEDLFFKGDAKLNIPLQPGDIINIPVDELVTIYVTGQVRSPGALQVKKSNIPTLLRAIAQAGGFSDRASRGGVIIKRVKEDGQEEVIKVDAKDIMRGKKKDIQLKENDVIIVPEKWL